MECAPSINFECVLHQMFLKISQKANFLVERFETKACIVVIGVNFSFQALLRDKWCKLQHEITLEAPPFSHCIHQTHLWVNFHSLKWTAISLIDTF